MNNPIVTKRRIRRRLNEMTLIRLPATPLEVDQGRAIWNGTGIVKRVTRKNRRKAAAFPSVTSISAVPDKAALKAWARKVEA